MSDITELKCLRAGSKAVCNRNLQICKVVLNNNDEVEITSLHKRLAGLLEKIKGYDENILDVITEEEMEEEIVQQNYYNVKTDDAIAKLEPALTRLQRENKLFRNKEVKPPNINLATVEGDPRTWTGFWELFKCAVDERADLSNVHKCTEVYLSKGTDARRCFNIDQWF